MSALKGSALDAAELRAERARTRPADVAKWAGWNRDLEKRAGASMLADPEARRVGGAFEDVEPAMFLSPDMSTLIAIARNLDETDTPATLETIRERWKVENEVNYYAHGERLLTEIEAIEPDRALHDQVALATELKVLQHDVLQRLAGAERREQSARDEDREDQDQDQDQDQDDYANSPGAPGPGRGGKRSIATQLVELARRASELWRSPTGDLYTTITVNDHYEHVRIGSREHRRWLARLGLVQLERAIGASSLGDACGALEGIARYDSETHPVHIRICGTDERVYIDLCDERWRAVEIDRDGWRVVERPPVRFERRNAMAPLPEPTRGETLAELQQHVRIADDSWALVLGWLVGALSPRGPYPVLVLRGQHGAGKSHGARRVRSLIDPSIAPIRSEPREPRDLVISARASHVIALDNLSTVPPWLSDGLCRLSTGGGYAARALYTDTDEIVIDVQRPVILTGITDVVTAPDLLDRSLLVDLEAIAPEDRETERVLDARWREAQPRILGALYDAVSMALARRDELKLPRLPRLADWATWATAAEPALGLRDGAVIGALDGQAEEVTEIAIDASIIARPLAAWIRSRVDPVWVGTAEDLRNLLTERADVATVRDKRWPTSARGLAGQLARIAPALAEIGVGVERLARGSGGVRGRGWRIERLGDQR